jgi:HK97 family phage portal protein
MGLINTLAGALGYEKRAYSMKDPYLAELFGARPSVSGQSVTATSATRVAAVHACVQLIAETTASLPLAPYRRLDDGGKVVDTEHPLYSVLHNKANQVQTAMEFREQFVASCLLTGNGYALKTMNGAGAITELLPLAPESVRPVPLVNGRIRYEVTTDSGTRIYTQDEILHLRYRSTDGYTGISPIAEARDVIGTAMAQQEFEGGFFKQGAKPSGVLQHPQRLGPDQLKNIQETFQQKHGGSANMNKLLVLEEGMQYQQISMSQRDAEYIESRRLTIDDICRIFRVPPPMVGVLQDATYSNISEQSRMLVSHTLRPWFVRIEQAMNEALLTPRGRRTHFIEHNAEGLLRGNQEERFNAYRVAREWGWLSVNEIRRTENMGDIGPEGDTYREPLNSGPVGAEEVA